MTSKGNQKIGKSQLFVVNKAIKLDSANNLLFYIRCQIYIKLAQFHKAFLDFSTLALVFKIRYEDINPLLKHPKFQSYLYNHNINNNDLSDIGVLDIYDIYMYKGMIVIC